MFDRAVSGDTDLDVEENHQFRCISSGLQAEIFAETFLLCDCEVYH